MPNYLTGLDLQVPKYGHAFASMSLCNFDTPYWRGADSLLVKKSESTPIPGINIVAGKDDYVVRLSGRVDIDSSPAIRDRLLALLHSRCAK